MNKYGMYTKQGTDVIHLTHQDTIEQAIRFFSEVKKMPILEFKKIFSVKKI